MKHFTEVNDYTSLYIKTFIKLLFDKLKIKEIIIAGYCQKKKATQHTEDLKTHFLRVAGQYQTSFSSVVYALNCN